jgi:hypothetical protein
MTFLTSEQIAESGLSLFYDVTKVKFKQKDINFPEKKD